MEIIVHAGLPKTGSTTLQSALAEKRAELVEQKIIYPQLSLKPDWQHWPLTAASLQDPSKHRLAYKLEPDPRANLDKALNEFASTARSIPDDGTLIISDEGFGNALRGNDITKFYNHLKTYSDNIKLIMYARHPVAAYTSGVQQRLKTKIKVSPPGQIQPFNGKQASFISSVFGPEDCYFRVFDRTVLYNSDILDDFSQAIEKISGKKLSFDTRRDVNISLSAWACSIIWIHGSKFSDRAEFQRFVRHLERFDQKQKNVKLQIPADWIPHIEKVQGADWNKFLQLSDISDDLKTLMRVNQFMSFSEVNDQHVDAWLRSYRDEKMEHRFLDQFTNPKKKKQD